MPFRKPCCRRLFTQAPQTQRLRKNCPACCEGPFGELLAADGPMAQPNPFRFSTKFQDDETGLLYYGYRYYNAPTGRWTGRDPIRERGGLSLYGALRNNPVSHVDVLGLSFKVIYSTAPPGTLNPDDPKEYGNTDISKIQYLKFQPKYTHVTCAHCVTLHVTQDYDVEVTSITPTTTPPGYSQNGFAMINEHEQKRVEIYRRAYEAYLAPVKGMIDGKYLCCSDFFALTYLGDWAAAVIEAYEGAFWNYCLSQNALVSEEMDVGNFIIVNGLIDGSRYLYTPGPMPSVGPLPEEPNCYDATHR